MEISNIIIPVFTTILVAVIVSLFSKLYEINQESSSRLELWQVWLITISFAFLISFFVAFLGEKIYYIFTESPETSYVGSYVQTPNHSHYIYQPFKSNIEIFLDDNGDLALKGTSYDTTGCKVIGEFNSTHVSLDYDYGIIRYEYVGTAFYDSNKDQVTNGIGKIIFNDFDKNGMASKGIGFFDDRILDCECEVKFRIIRINLSG